MQVQNNMEATQTMMNSSLTSSDDKNEERSTTDSNLDTAPTTSSSPPDEEGKGCRKSSRLKAKMVRQSQQEESQEAGDAYNLRLSSLVKRVQVERRQTTPKPPKGKSKPPPLSKYRRRTANARERMRMKEINEGFERLRESLPEMDQLSDEGKKKEKPTKLTVLNLALNYIHALRDILGFPAMGGDSGEGCSSSISSSSGEGCSSSISSSSGEGCSSSSSRLSEESDLGSDAASTRTLSTSSSASCDEVCSNPSPDSSVLDMKEFSLADAPSSFIASAIPKAVAGCYDSASSASLMDFRGEARSSPSSSDLSLPPTPPPLPLPEECMEIDQADLLGVSISLAELEDIDDIML